MGFRSGEEMEQDYGKVLLQESKTREEEFARQQKLNALLHWIAGYEEGVRRCQGFILHGNLASPSDDAEREKINTVKTDIARIDQLLLQAK